MSLDLQERKTAEKLKLQLKRVIKAPRKQVFDAWTKPELMRKWFAPGAMTVASVTADARVGGSYEIQMAGANCSGEEGKHGARGTYKKIVADELICFTWNWSDDPALETVVTLQFKDVHGGTELTLMHEGFMDAETLGKHEHGWNGCLENLAKLCE